jgi:hypothetical protein
MSIPALTAAAAQLLDYFESAKANIDSAVSAAIAAIPAKGYVSYYLDSIAGDDTAPGTISAPMRTFAGLTPILDYRIGFAATIYLARDGSYTLPLWFVGNSRIVITGEYDPRSVGSGRPTVGFGYRLLEGEIDSRCISGESNNVQLRHCVIQSPTIEAGDESRNVYVYGGIASGEIGVSTRFNVVDIYLNDLPVVDTRNRNIELKDVAFTRVGPAKLAEDLGEKPVLLHMESTVFAPNEDVHDIFGFAAFDGGEPIGVLANFIVGQP